MDGWTTVFKYLKSNYRQDGDEFFSVAIGVRTRSNGQKLQKGKFKLENKRNFLTLRIIDH